MDFRAIGIVTDPLISGRQDGGAFEVTLAQPPQSFIRFLQSENFDRGGDSRLVGCIKKIGSVGSSKIGY
jgi:hypothetical protein